MTPATGPKIIIVGGGVAGLACGCYLQMNGYRTEILEAGAAPGGLCAAWDRGPYTFDGCLRWLVGTHPLSAFHQVWNELGALDSRGIVNHDEFLRVEGADGQVLSMSADPDRLAENLKQVAPADSARIDELVGAARRCACLEPPLEKPLELMTALERTRLLLRYFPVLFSIVKWKNRPMGAYLSTYRSPFLREALMAVAGDARMSALVLVMVLGFRFRKNTGYVAGGSRALTQAIAGRYARLGGVIRCHTEVVSITVERGRATGVRCADGSVVPAAIVVSCADGHTTIFKLLAGRYLTRGIVRAYKQDHLFPSLVQVSLGIDQTFPDAPHDVSLPLSPPLLVDDTTRHDRMEVALFGADSGLCPTEKSIMVVRFPSRYEYWASLKHRHPAGYAAAKEDLLRQTIRMLDQRFGGVARRIDQADLATPATFARYTANWQGSTQGWLPTPRSLGRRLPRTLPGLKDFYMAGHWVERGGGLPPAVLSGRYVAQMICARDGRGFGAAAS